MDVPATPGAAATGTVLLYGHLDKQPPLGDWSEGLGPWQAVVRDDRLYGRGSADDGYSGYAATTALDAVRAAGGEHARAVLLLETGEESGSPDLPAYLEHLVRPARRGVPGGLPGRGRRRLRADVADLQPAWRGAGDRHGARPRDVRHSGLASGVVPSSFRVMRRLLDRLEDSGDRRGQGGRDGGAHPGGTAGGGGGARRAPCGGRRAPVPVAAGMRAASDDDVELVLNNTWRPTLSVTGAGGLPDPAVAGAVLRASTSLRLSFRLPPRSTPRRRGPRW